MLLISFGYKLGLPGLHFFKFELYKYLDFLAIFFFSGLTIFINLFLFYFYNFIPVISIYFISYSYFLLSFIFLGFLLVLFFRQITISNFLAFSGLLTLSLNVLICSF